MPELSPGARGAVAGSWIRADLPARHYGPDDAGGICESCRLPMVAALAGELLHPTCEPDFVPMVKRLQNLLRRRARRVDNG